MESSSGTIRRKTTELNKHVSIKEARESRNGQTKWSNQKSDGGAAELFVDAMELNCRTIIILTKDHEEEVFGGGK